MPELTIALFQAAPDFHTSDRALAALDDALSRAARSGARLLVTPELYLSGYGRADAVRAAAQQVTSPGIQAASLLAARHGIGLVLGYPERSDKEYFNSAVVFDGQGRLLHNYRKMALPNDFERSCFCSGTGPQVFEFEGVRCSVVICYDVEFPEIPRRAALAGAELIIVPTALRARWRFVSDCIVPARAYENAMFVAYCDYAAHGPKPVYSGASAICAPDGSRLKTGSAQNGLLLATIDTDAVATRKADFDFLESLKELNTLNRPLIRFA